MKLKKSANSIGFRVHAIPRSSYAGVVGKHDGSLKVKLNSPPIDGAANSELITILAKFFKVSKRSVEITSGETSRKKSVTIQGEMEALINKLDALD